MKIAIPFVRARSRRPAPRPHHDIANWTLRAWADLPAHHPRRD
jgi:hypothetical protein